VDTVNLLKIGSREFTVLLYAPSLTAQGHGTGKKSGLYVWQTDLSSTGVQFNAIADGHSMGLSQVKVYGTDISDIGLHGSCFSGKIQMAPLVPQANLIGHYWSGEVTLGQLMSDNGSSVVVSVDSLISIADKTVHKHDGTVQLQSCVQNASSLLEAYGTAASTAPIPISDGQMLAEVAHFVVLPRFAANVLQNTSNADTANLTRFTFQVEVSSNWIFWQRLSPASNSLKNTLIKSKRTDTGIDKPKGASSYYAKAQK